MKIIASQFRQFAMVVFGAIILVTSACRADEKSEVAPAVGIHWEKYSDAVFARAKKENRFVLIDLEAVWCHWCHVQDEVTYRDPKVIELIESRYVAVKVDQDSRPDLSNRYEDYGWPATIVLNAEGGEIVKRSGYIPPMPMARLLQAIIDDPSPGPSVRPAEKIEFASGSALTPELGKELIGKLNDAYDAKEGGWGTIHKFVDWDAEDWTMELARAGDKEAESRARQTLDAGIGLIDPVWGGVYQYSTDDDWKHQHFEKLMQFQSEYLRIYSLGYAQFHEDRYLKAAQSIRGYIANFLTSPEGAFYVSQDADLIPGEHSADYFALDDAARRKLGVPRVDIHCYARENGWAIRGILALYEVTHDAADLEAASRTADWVVANRSLDGGGFKHSDHDAAGPYLGDTLAMGRAFLALYEATADRKWLDRAQSAADFIAAHFAAAGAGGNTSAAGFITAAPIAGDPMKPAPEVDENVAAARFFNLLGHYKGNKADHAAAAEAMRLLATPQVARSRGFQIAGILLASHELTHDPLHVTIVGSRNDSAARALFQEALTSSTGYKRIEWWDPSQGPLPNGDVQYPELGHAAAFVCTNGACSSPLVTIEALTKRLNR